MIKSLLDADENPPPETQVIIEDTVINPTAGMAAAPETVPETINRTTETETILEIPGFDVEPENASEIFDTQRDAVKYQPVAETIPEVAETHNAQNEEMLFQSVAPQTGGFVPETQAETIRKSGLAYAAAITLFGSVAFLLLIGWFADLILGTSPWGTIGGIVLGSIIGFTQFFRMTSQILKNKD